MILSERDAKTKICPIIAASSVLDETQCRASGCMMWRWVPRKSPEEIAERKTWQGDAVPEPKGYCGH